MNTEIANLRVSLSVSKHFTNKYVPSTMFFATDWLAEEWTAEQIAAHIGAGGAVSVAAVRDKYRDEAHFLSAQIIGVDFDSGPSVDELCQTDPFISKHAFLVYATANSKPEAPRSRALFILEKPILIVDEYRALVAKILKHYSLQADANCKDATRIFYGSTNHDRCFNPSARLTLAAVNELTSPEDFILPPTPAESTRSVQDILANGAMPGSRNSDALRLVGYFSNLMPKEAIEGVLRLWYDRLPDKSDFDFKLVQGMIDRMSERAAPTRAAVNDALHATSKATVIEGAASPVITPFSMFASGEEAEITWAIDNWMPDATTALMVAPPGSFKTWLALAIGLSMATGKPLFNRYATSRPSPVLVIQQEDHKGILRQRMRTIYTSMFENDPFVDIPDIFSMPYIIPDLDIFTADETLRLADNAGMNRLRALIAARGYKLVILDPLYAAADSEGYMASDAQRMTEFKRIRDKMGTSFLVLHHTRKTTTGEGGKLNRLDAWGSQFLNAWLETRIQLAGGPADNIIKVERSFKSSPMKPKEQLTFDINTEGENRWFRVTTEQNDAAGGTPKDDILEFIKAQGKVKNADIAARFGINTSTASRRMQSLLKKGLVMKDEVDQTYSMPPVF